MPQRQAFFTIYDGRVKMIRGGAYHPTIDAIWLADTVRISPHRGGDRKTGRRGTTVLDVGIGTGAVSLCLLARAPNVKITGIDNSETMLEECAENIKLNGYSVFGAFPAPLWGGSAYEFGFASVAGETGTSGEQSEQTRKRASLRATLAFRGGGKVVNDGYYDTPTQELLGGDNSRQANSFSPLKGAGETPSNKTDASLLNPIELIHADIFTWKTDRTFDIVVTNPPYFRGSARTGGAHHNIDIFEWVRCCARRVRPRGRIYVIVDAAQTAHVIAALHPAFGDINIMPIFTNRDTAERVIISARLGVKTGTTVNKGISNKA